MKFFPRRKRQKSLPRPKDRQWTIHPTNQRLLPRPTNQPSNVTIYTPPESDVLHIDESQEQRGRWLIWHKIVLFACFVAFIGILWGYAGILNQQETRTAAPIVILPTQTPDLAAQSIMNATATVALSDANRHATNNTNEQKNNELINDAVSQAKATTVSSDTSRHTAVNANAATLEANGLENALLIANKQAASQIEILEAQTEAEKARIRSEIEATKARQQTVTSSVTILSAGMSSMLVGAILYLIANSKPLLSGLTRPTVVKMTNDAPKQPTRQRKPRRQPTEPLSSSNQDTAPSKVRTDSPIDFLKTAQRMMVVGVTGTGKTTIATALAATRSNCIAIDPKPRTKWGNHVKVVGRGYEDDTVTSELANLINEMKSRSQRMIDDESYTPDDLFIFLDEWPYLVSLDGAKETIIKLILQGREFGMYVVLLTQSDDVKTLGISGQGQLRESFVIVRLKNTRGKRTAHIVWGDDEYMFMVPKLGKRSPKRAVQVEPPTQQTANPDPSQSPHAIRFVHSGQTREVTLPIAVQAKLVAVAQAVQGGSNFSHRGLKSILSRAEFSELSHIFKSANFVTQEPNRAAVFTPLGESFLSAVVGV